MPAIVTILLLLLALVLFLAGAFDLLKSPKVNPVALGLAVWVFIQLMALVVK